MYEFYDHSSNLAQDRILTTLICLIGVHFSMMLLLLVHVSITVASMAARLSPCTCSSASRQNHSTNSSCWGLRMLSHSCWMSFSPLNDQENHLLTTISVDFLIILLCQLIDVFYFDFHTFNSILVQYALQFHLGLFEHSRCVEKQVNFWKIYFSK